VKKHGSSRGFHRLETVVRSVQMVSNLLDCFDILAAAGSGGATREGAPYKSRCATDVLPTMMPTEVDVLLAALLPGMLHACGDLSERRPERCSIGFPC
jgi:hypothetical protein